MHRRLLAELKSVADERKPIRVECIGPKRAVFVGDVDVAPDVAAGNNESAPRGPI